MRKLPSSPVAVGLVCFGLLAAGLLHAQDEPPQRNGKVILFLSTDCPMAQRYAPRFASLYNKYKNLFDFEAAFPNDGETKFVVDHYMADRKLTFPSAIDPGAVRAKELGVEFVPTLVVFDKDGQKAYSGALDDNTDPNLVKHHMVEDVLDKLAVGKKVAFRSTPPNGCLVMPGRAPIETTKVNYAEHVANIINKNCVECHRPGEVAPFSLVGYEQARKWAPMLALVTARHQMPPWKAVHGYGEFMDEHILSEADIATLRNWDRAGAPRGPIDKEPPSPTFKSDWALGEPDLVISQAQPYTLEADGSDVYRNFVVKTDFAETKWVNALAVRPGNTKIVHHVIAFLDERGQSEKLLEKNKDGKEGYSSFGGVGFLPDGAIGGWAPGVRARRLLNDTAFELRPGTRIVIQIHYHKSGREEKDQTKIGLYFAKEAPKRPMNLGWLANLGLKIPADADKFKSTMTYEIPRNITLHAVMPHMHLLGTSMKAEVEMPDGTTEPLIWIDRWDFNWQLSYMLKEPLKIPKGSKIKVEALYNNTVTNINNPNNPPKLVKWGEETTDEMFLLVAAYTFDDTPPPGRGFVQQMQTFRLIDSK